MKNIDNELTFRSEAVERLGDVQIADILEKTGMSLTSFKNAVAGISPSYLRVIQLAKYFKTNISYLLCLTEDRSMLDRYDFDPARIRFNLLRNLYGESLGTIKDSLGFSSTTISKIAKGDFPTRLPQIVAYAKHFDVSPDYLLGLTDRRNWGSDKSRGSAGSVIKIADNDQIYYAIIDINGNVYTTLGQKYTPNQFAKAKLQFMEVKLP